MILQTKRLLLRPWQDSDAEDLYRYAGSPEVGPIAGWPVHASVQNSLAILRGVLSEPETYAVVPKAVGHAVGSVGLMIGKASALGIPETEGEIGYWIGVPFGARASSRKRWRKCCAAALWTWVSKPSGAAILTAT